MKTQLVELYTIDELKAQFPEGYKRAIEKYEENDEYPLLDDEMTEEANNLIKENKDITDFDNLKVYYSLSYCQGDGAQINGTFDYKGMRFKVQHAGHYYHEEAINMSDEVIDEDSPLYADKEAQRDIYADFHSLITSIGKKLANLGYAYIESEREECNIIENIRANDQYFTKNGRTLVI